MPRNVVVSVGIYVICPQTISIICNLSMTYGFVKCMDILQLFILLLYDYELAAYPLIILSVMCMSESVHTCRDIYHTDHIIING